MRHSLNISTTFLIPFVLALASCLFSAGILFAQLRGYQTREGIAIAVSVIFVLGALARFVVGEEPSLRSVVEQWVSLYGRDTAKAALLTTDRFQEGETLSVWAERTDRTLKQVGYEHRGSRVIKEEVHGKMAMVFLKAKITTMVGMTEQTEIYTLIREGERWLIDALNVGDEEAPEEEESVA